MYAWQLQTLPQAVQPLAGPSTPSPTNIPLSASPLAGSYQPCPDPSQQLSTGPIRQSYAGLSRQPDPLWQPGPSQQPGPSRQPDPSRQPGPSRQPDPLWQLGPSRQPDLLWQPDPSRQPDPSWQPDPSQQFFTGLSHQPRTGFSQQPLTDSSQQLPTGPTHQPHAGPSQQPTTDSFLPSFGPLQAPPLTNPSPLPFTLPVSATTVVGYGRELSNLAKLYTDEAKYSGEDDSFTFKLAIFHDICAQANIPHEAKLKAFPTMLKGLALDYYYSNISISGNVIAFDEACYLTRAYFEGAEYKRSVLSR